LIISKARSINEEKTVEDLEPPDETHQLEREKFVYKPQEVNPC